MKFKFGILAIVLAMLLIGAYWLARQPAGDDNRPLVVGVVQLTPVDATTLQGFKEGMGKLGYREGKDIIYLDEGPAGTIDRLEPLIRRQLAAKPRLFFVSSTPATQAVKNHPGTSGIPVVFAPVNDPVNAGVVASLKAPGGNITGIRLPAGDDLRLEWLKKIAPSVKQVYLPYNPADRSALASLELARQAAAVLGIELLAEAIRSGEEVRPALAALPANVDAIFLPRDSTIEARIADFTATALERRLPLCAPSLLQVEAGALFSYGFMHHQIGQQAARLADQILRGTAPADLPVETAESRLVINQATARAIGLPIPGEILRQAEQVIRPQTDPTGVRHARP